MYARVYLCTPLCMRVYILVRVHGEPKLINMARSYAASETQQTFPKRTLSKKLWQGTSLFGFS